MSGLPEDENHEVKDHVVRKLCSGESCTAENRMDALFGLDEQCSLHLSKIQSPWYKDGKEQEGKEVLHFAWFGCWMSKMLIGRSYDGAFSDVMNTFKFLMVDDLKELQNKKYPSDLDEGFLKNLDSIKEDVYNFPALVRRVPHSALIDGEGDDFGALALSGGAAVATNKMQPTLIFDVSKHDRKGIPGDAQFTELMNRVNKFLTKDNEVQKKKNGLVTDNSEKAPAEAILSKFVVDESSSSSNFSKVSLFMRDHDIGY